MTTQRRLWSLAARQHWLLATAQLHTAGLTPAAIEHRVGTGRLHHQRRGVYAVGRPVTTRESFWMAAVLAVGPDAVVSHLTAALLWGIVDRSEPLIHLSVPTQSGRGQRGDIRVHRCATLRPELVTVHRLIPVTGVFRTLRDVAGELRPAELRSAVRQAERLHRVDLPRLRELVDAPLTAHREARLRKLLDSFVPAADVNPGLEERFFEALVRHRVPLPLTQQWIEDFRVDFLWPDERLVVETDDRTSHDTWSARADDVARDRRLHALGYTVLRFTWREVRDAPDAVAAEIRAALRRASARHTP